MWQLNKCCQVFKFLSNALNTKVGNIMQRKYVITVFNFSLARFMRCMLFVKILFLYQNFALLCWVPARAPPRTMLLLLLIFMTLQLGMAISCSFCCMQRWRCCKAYSLECLAAQLMCHEKLMPLFFLFLSRNRKRTPLWLKTKQFSAYQRRSQAAVFNFR